MTLKLCIEAALFTCDVRGCANVVTMDIGKGRPGSWSKLEFDSPMERISQDLCDVCTEKMRTLLKGRQP